MDQKYVNDTMFWYYKDLDENLEWITEKTEEPNVIKDILLPPPPPPDPPPTHSKCNWTVK